MEYLLFCLIQEGNLIICYNMSESGGHCINKPDIER